MSIDTRPLYQAVHDLVRVVRGYGPDHFTPAAGKFALDFLADRLAQTKRIEGAVLDPADLAAHLRALADQVEANAEKLRTIER